MANTTQDQEKNANERTTANEEIVSESEDHKGGEGEEDDESKSEKPLDHDQDRRNPQYIPKAGAFYEHDNRTSSEDLENKDPQDADKKKKVWRESKESERWLHDCYNECEQLPKSKAEIIEIYGYDIRNEEAPPRARRRRKYGRGPDKYNRNWEDEQAYSGRQNVHGRKGWKKQVFREEFPPLPNQDKYETDIEEPPQRHRNWKKHEEDARPKKTNIQEKYPKVGRSQSSKNDIMHSKNSTPGFHVSRNAPLHNPRRVNDDYIKPFKNDRNKVRNDSFRRRRPEGFQRPIKTKSVDSGECHTPRSTESNKNSSDSDVAHLAENFGQMTFHSKQSNIRGNRTQEKHEKQEKHEVSEQDIENPVSKLNPKRYSKIRKNFTGFFPPEEIVDLDSNDIKQIQQEQQKNQHISMQQPLNIQNMIRRYPGNYNGTPSYVTARPVITGIPQQAMSPQGLQQALSPQGIPQQALSPQLPGLQPLELQQGPLPPQANFVPPLYIDMDPHYPPDMLTPYAGYSPFSASQPSEIYQSAGGTTFYSTECQNSSQSRPPQAPRQKSIIPIIPPPK